MSSHEVMGGKVNLYKRGSVWHCSASLTKGRFRTSTKEESLAKAKQVAEDWYLTLVGKDRAGLLTSEKTFEQAAKQFLKEYEIITEGQRSPVWVKGHALRLRLHLLPFFGQMGVSQITAGKLQEYRMERITNSKSGKAPARSTIHDEVVTLRQTLKTAIRHGWLDHLPDLSPPYKTQGKIVHRPWFSPAEYKQLFEATRAYAREPQNARFKWNAEQVHDFVLFLANTGLRPDEAKNLQHRDVTIVKDRATGEHILEIEVRGKRGIGFCKSMPQAVHPYERLKARGQPIGPSQTARAQRERGEAINTNIKQGLKYPQPTDPVFPGNSITVFNGVLERAKLKLDRDGNRRTAYSLRHTYICMRLMEGADIYQIAKNCRTSVEMIEKFYAAHIKNTLDAAAINVYKQETVIRKSRPKNRAFMNEVSA